MRVNTDRFVVGDLYRPWFRFIALLLPTLTSCTPTPGPIGDLLFTDSHIVDSQFTPKKKVKELRLGKQRANLRPQLSLRVRGNIWGQQGEGFRSTEDKLQNVIFCRSVAYWLEKIRRAGRLHQLACCVALGMRQADARFAL